MVKTILAVIGGVSVLQWTVDRVESARVAGVPLDVAFKHPFTPPYQLARLSPSITLAPSAVTPKGVVSTSRPDLIAGALGIIQ